MAESSASSPSRSRDFLLTVPRQTCTTASQLQQIFVDIHALSAVFQLEKGGKTGYEHWQIFLRFKNQKRFATLKGQLTKKGLKTAHIESRKGTVEQAIKYCSKAETRLDGPYFFGDKIDTDTKKGERTDLQKLRDKVLIDGLSFDEIMLEDKTGSAARYTAYLRSLIRARDKRKTAEFRHLSVMYLYGPAGVGKSRWALENNADKSCYRVSDYSHPFDAYDGEDVLILDEFDGSMSLTLLLNILDGYSMELPARYENKYARYTSVVIISNRRLGDLYTYLIEDSPERLRALYRRIGRYSYMDNNQTIIDKRLPTIDSTHRYIVDPYTVDEIF